MQSGEHRPSTIRDVLDSARLLDALAGVDSVTPFFSPQDVPGALMGLAMYRHTLPGTSKPVSSPGFMTAAEARWLVRLAEVIGVPAEVLALSISPISPLQLPDDLAGAILETARMGIAFIPLPAPTAGATAPMSLAGLLAQQNAEVLAMVTLVQLIHPGLPVMYCGRQSVMDPRSGAASWGVAALGLASAAVVQLGHHYGLPVNVYGLCTDSNSIDFQSGYERALNALLPALAGADELSGIGNMGTGTFGSYAQMVCDNDIVLEIKRLCKGFEVSEDSLATGLVAEVTAEGGSGNFLAERHTVKTLRSGEVFFPPLSVRRSFEDWELAGRETMRERACAKAEKILSEHTPEPLSAAQEKELDTIMAAAARELAG